MLLSAAKVAWNFLSRIPICQIVKHENYTKYFDSALVKFGLRWFGSQYFLVQFVKFERDGSEFKTLFGPMIHLISQVLPSIANWKEIQR